MKKIFFIFSFILLTTLNAMTFAGIREGSYLVLGEIAGNYEDGILLIGFGGAPSISIEAGKTKTVAIWGSSDIDMTGFQIDLVLPEGLTIATNGNGEPDVTLNTTNAPNHQIMTTILENGNARIHVTSLDNTVLDTFGQFVGESGTFFYTTLVFITFQASDNFIGDYSIDIINEEQTCLETAYINQIYGWDCPVTGVGTVTLAESISLNQTNAELAQGQTLQLTATVLPEGATNKAVTWSSNDEDVATVDTNGLVTAVGWGECDIFATLATNDAVYASCHITTSYPEITISLESGTARVAPNGMITLIPMFDPIETDIAVTTSDSNVAFARVVRVSAAPASGEPMRTPVEGTQQVQIVGVSYGTATITISSADGKAVPAVCEVTVAPATGVEDINVDGYAKTQRYNILGQPVDENFRGIVIENGKKVMK